MCWLLYCWGYWRSRLAALWAAACSLRRLQLRCLSEQGSVSAHRQQMTKSLSRAVPLTISVPFVLAAGQVAPLLLLPGQVY